MVDGGIEDNQLQASSVWMMRHDVYMARPHQAGWCAAYDDTTPFYQVS